MKQYYKIAGLVVEMDSFGRTEQRAKAYLCRPADPDVIIESFAKQLKAEQPHLSEDDCEYLSTGQSFYHQLLDYNGILVHASAVVIDGRAYIFTAPCGTGKSTHTNLWLKLFKGRAFILNDDKPALRYVDGVWYAYGTPWSGKHDLNENVCVPVGGICYLHQAQENSIQRLYGANAAFCILEQTARPGEKETRFKIMQRLDTLISNVPVWRMGCNMDISAAIMSYETMSGNKFNTEE